MAQASVAPAIATVPPTGVEAAREEEAAQAKAAYFRSAATDEEE